MTYPTPREIVFSFVFRQMLNCIRLRTRSSCHYLFCPSIIQPAGLPLWPRQSLPDNCGGSDPRDFEMEVGIGLGTTLQYWIRHCAMGLRTGMRQ